MMQEVCLQSFTYSGYRNEAKFLFLKKKSKWPTKKNHFSAPPILDIFWRKFHGLVLWLVGLIDAKGIGVAQPI